MECVGSAVISRVSEETEFGIAGRWKHAFLEALREGASIEEAASKVPAEYREACESLDSAALKGLEALQSEVGLKFNVKSRVGALCADPMDTGFDDIYARTDLGGVLDDVACVIDVKTGRHDVESARNNWQLLAAAIALSQLRQLSKARVAILYLREGQKARWDIADLDGLDLETAMMQLEQLGERISRIRKKGETPPVRMGEWCRFCPSKLYCPAHTSLIRMFVKDDVAAVNTLKALLTPEMARQAKAQADLVRNALRNLDSALYSYARENPIPVGDGKVWGPRVVQRDVVDGPLSYQLLNETYGLDVAVKASTFDVTKKGVREAMRVVQQSIVEAGGEKPTLVELERQALGRLRDAGAIVKVEKEVFEEHRPEEATHAMEED
jgi:CRISPR/Cas system-associated exonuclease Cas4 (RecB family)